jgi:hypothetical protein
VPKRNYSQYLQVLNQGVKEMRIYFIIFSFFIISCNSDSTEYPIPEKNQIYEHNKTGEKIGIFDVGSGEDLRNKAEEMDWALSGKLLTGSKKPPAIIYNTDNADEKCICYYKVVPEKRRIEWYIITVEEIALDYKLVKIDSLGQFVPQ